MNYALDGNRLLGQARGVRVSARRSGLERAARLLFEREKLEGGELKGALEAHADPLPRADGRRQRRPLGSAGAAADGRKRGS